MGTTLILTAALFCVVFLGLAGCAALIPGAVRPEVEHQSHVLQHLGPTRTNYGTDTVGVAAVWRRGHWTAEVSEHFDLQKEYAPGCAAGCRDVFDARLGYEIPVRH